MTTKPVSHEILIKVQEILTVVENIAKKLNIQTGIKSKYEITSANLQASLEILIKMQEILTGVQNIDKKLDIQTETESKYEKTLATIMSFNDPKRSWTHDELVKVILTRWNESLDSEHFEDMIKFSVVKSLDYLIELIGFDGVVSVIKEQLPHKPIKDLITVSNWSEEPILIGIITKDKAGKIVDVFRNHMVPMMATLNSRTILNQIVKVRDNGMYTIEIEYNNPVNLENVSEALMCLFKNQSYIKELNTLAEMEVFVLVCRHLQFKLVKDA